MTPICCHFGATMVTLRQISSHTEANIMAAKVETRISARVPEHVYDTLTRAAELCGATVNQFLVQSALDRARTVIEEESIIRLDAETAKRFFAAIENPPEPNEKLLAAFHAHKERL
jgi:uncharacterized protein (DUF1778 family)